jgi:hypothetical protein
MTVKKTQTAGGNSGANNNMKMKMKGGSSCGASNKMKVGGAKSKKTTKKSSHKLAKDEANCFKCKSAGKKFHVKFINPVNKTVKNSKRTVKGISAKCPVCGGKVFKIVGA